MSKYNIMPFSVIFLLVLLISDPVRPDDLENFVILKLADYTAWLKDSNLDPTPAEPWARQLEATNAVVNLECNLTELAVQGHSDDVHNYGTGETNLLRGLIVVDQSSYGNVTFFGKYSANGTLFSSIPFSGEGNWSIRVSQVNLSYWWLRFGINATGYLNITEGNFPNAYISDSIERDVHFENLWDSGAAEGYEEFVKEALFHAFTEDFRYGLENPLKSLYVQYFQEIFDVTPLSEIIGTTLPTDPPPTTMDPTTPTTPSSSTTTQDPCLLKNSHVEVLEETIVEQVSSFDSDGVPIVITKKTVITKERQEL